MLEKASLLLGFVFKKFFRHFMCVASNGISGWKDLICIMVAKTNFISCKVVAPEDLYKWSLINSLPSLPLPFLNPQLEKIHCSLRE